MTTSVTELRKEYKDMGDDELSTMSFDIWVELMDRARILKQIECLESGYDPEAYCISADYS